VSSEQGAQTPESSDPTPAEPGRNDAKLMRGCGLGCGGVLLAFLVLVVAYSCGAGGSDDWEPTETEARLICEDWVRAKLKAPDTAKFNDGESSGAGVAWTISGTVDAENSFGANLRAPWTCDVRWDESTERWRGSATLVE